MLDCWFEVVLADCSVLYILFWCWLFGAGLWFCVDNVVWFAVCLLQKICFLVSLMGCLLGLLVLFIWGFCCTLIMVLSCCLLVGGYCGCLWLLLLLVFGTIACLISYLIMCLFMLLVTLSVYVVICFWVMCL